MVVKIRGVTTDPTARALRLLSLLQTYKFWAGAELAERLEVSARTLRRDVDRLRELGYAAEAPPGAAGGYRLSAGAHLPPSCSTTTRRWRSRSGCARPPARRSKASRRRRC